MDAASLYQTVYIDGRCPRCGALVTDVEKDTSSGRELHLFWCSSCQWVDFIDVGIAFWKLLPQGIEEEAAARKEKARKEEG
jgi:hypothetical protein